MLRTLLFAAVLPGVCLQAQAQESLLVGRVERIVLLPAGTQECPPACPPGQPAGADGARSVCVSNAGGCQRTAFQVERVLLGPGQPGPRDFSGRLGEWGRQDFPVIHDPILVHVEDGRVRWSRIVERGGQAWFEAAPLEGEVIAGIPVASLAPDADGQVPLARLLERVGARR
ncbi:hypothetical protein [uncultured Massilia sp.]|uniref:hypothetical protein n=1 Tax=uncultured Massilia sp. TaxID=169973 RepID=UPI0025D57808|nr:hypothetical protein [uncultured Massilia sp.]